MALRATMSVTMDIQQLCLHYCRSAIVHRGSRIRVCSPIKASIAATSLSLPFLIKYTTHSKEYQHHTLFQSLSTSSATMPAQAFAIMNLEQINAEETTGPVAQGKDDGQIQGFIPSGYCVIAREAAVSTDVAKADDGQIQGFIPSGYCVIA